jgi:hypothetical protein
MLPNAQPKARPKLLDKRDAQRDIAKLDREQRAICKARSGGRCEVVVAYEFPLSVFVDLRCIHRATENHHLLGGIGRRNRGRSIKAEHRLEVCSWCHAEITGHVLVPIGTGREEAQTVRFERKK